ncbi:MAG: PEGA domain-containing protein [Ignavibacteria bacterium]|nr:PEGA domain-containing protein [Ignavibacteria bacterium]
MKHKRLFVALCLATLSSSVFSQCALIFSGTKGLVHFDASPEASEVWVDGAFMGTTPCRIALKKSVEHTVEFRKAGYTPRSYKLQNSIGAGWVILDVIGGLIPVIVDATTGAWYQFDQDHVNSVLQKQQ